MIINKTKKTPKLRFPEFRDEWQKLKIGDLGKVITGNTPPTNDQKSYGGDHLFVSPVDIQENRYIRNTATRLSDSGFTKIREIPSGSTLFVCIGSTIGKIAQTKTRVATNQQINAVIPGNGYDQNFVFTLLQRYSPRIKKLAATQAVPIVSKSEFSGVMVQVPSLAEQQKIAEFLTAVDEKIAAIKKKKELLEQYKKGAMQAIFSQHVRFHDPSGNPYQYWEEKTLEELNSFKKGTGLSKDDLGEVGQYKAIHYGELFTKYNEVITHVFSNSTIDTGVRSLPGDILMPTSDVTPSGLARASSIQEGGVVLGGDINVLRPTPEVNSIFLSYLMNAQKKKIMDVVSGTTIKHVYASDLKKLRYQIPHSIEEQQKIAGFLTVLDQRIELEVKKLVQAQQFKKSLLQRMFV